MIAFAERTHVSRASPGAVSGRHKWVVLAVALLAAMLVLPLTAQAQQTLQPMRFAVVENDADCADCRYVRAVGDIETYTAAQFRQFVRRHQLDGQSMTVVLSSPGGDVVAGVRLGREFRRLGFNTQVGFAQRLPGGGFDMRPGDCASACTFAFLGGVARYAEDDVIGVHRFYPGNLEPDTRIIRRPGDEAVAAMIKVYALDMGVDPAFIDTSLEVPPADMLYLSNDELRTFTVVNVEGPLSLVASRSSVTASKGLR